MKWSYLGFGYAFGIVGMCAAFGSTESIGPNGINSEGLLGTNGQVLTGAGINIGQIEVARPGKLTTDGGPDDGAHSNITVVPTAVFLRDMAAIPNQNIDLGPPDFDHSEQVAGVMISTHATAKGVATGAALYSTADGDPSTNIDEVDADSAQHIIDVTGTQMRAINLSFGNVLEAGHITDGNSLLTLFLDWSASTHDILYVVAGNEEAFGGGPVPTDNYNGITVAASSQVAFAGKFRQVAEFNSFGAGEDAFGDRTSISLLAPGNLIEVPRIGNMVGLNSGTSFAAPHVTGTVALLQEFATLQINGSAPRWDADARRHEVMKAVLLNSADKIEDTGNGDLLGMERDVLDTAEEDWLASNAYTDETIPLDIQMGAGHLNANRALKQFRNGEFDPGGAADPVIGWDYGATNADDAINKYVLSQPLRSGSFISITLAWDRTVLFSNDGGTIGAYDIGDTFVEDLSPTDLDLYLMPAGATGLTQRITRSYAPDMTLEHIFFIVPTTQQYEIWVHQFNSPFGDPQNYALAWWAVPAIVATSQGDYDGSGVVDAEDYRVWRANFGTMNAMADGNGNGTVDAADYVVWRTNLGQQVGSGGVLRTAVPEPGALVLLGLTPALVFFRRGNQVLASGTGDADHAFGMVPVAGYWLRLEIVLAPQC